MMGSRPAAQATVAPVRFGFVGRLHRTKGIVEPRMRFSGFLRAWRLRSRFADLIRRQRTRAGRRYSQPSRPTSVNFGGPVPHGDVPTLLASLDLLAACRCGSRTARRSRSNDSGRHRSSAPVRQPGRADSGRRHRPAVAPGDDAALGGRSRKSLATRRLSMAGAPRPRVRTMDDRGRLHGTYQSLRERAVA